MIRSIHAINRLRTLIIIRLFVATLLLFCAQFVFTIESTVFYAIISITSILSAVYLIWWMRGRFMRLLADVQIFCDLLLESFLIYYTGGIDSMFAPIYVLTILCSAWVISPSSSFVTAGASGLMFVVVSLSHAFELTLFDPLLAMPIPTQARDPIYLFYASYVRLTVFFLVAILAFYFTAHIRKLEEQVKTQERLVYLGELTSSIAHELRNPLASISGTVELLAHQLSRVLDNQQKKLMNAVTEESGRVSRIFNEMLDYARMPALKVDAIDMVQLMDQILLLMPHQPAFNEKVKVNKVYSGKKNVIRADAEYIKQAVLNIVINAYEAMPNGGELTIDAVESRNDFRISIQDTGYGMDPKTLSAVFTPFKTGKPGGTGLGMAQAQKIINQHKGRIHVKSKIGTGTLVEIILPVM